MLSTTIRILLITLRKLTNTLTLLYDIPIKYKYDARHNQNIANFTQSRFRNLSKKFLYCMDADFLILSIAIGRLNRTSSSFDINKPIIVMNKY